MRDSFCAESAALGWTDWDLEEALSESESRGAQGMSEVGELILGLARPARVPLSVRPEEGVLIQTDREG